MFCLICGKYLAYDQQFCSESCYKEYIFEDCVDGKSGICTVCNKYVENDLFSIDTVDDKTVNSCGLCLESTEFDDDGYLILKGETIHESINISQDHGHRPGRVA